MNTKIGFLESSYVILNVDFEIISVAHIYKVM